MTIDPATSSECHWTNGFIIKYPTIGSYREFD